MDAATETHLEDELAIAVSEDEAERRMTFCDRCGLAVRAHIEWTLPSGYYLKLCLHHSNKWRAALYEQGAMPTDLSEG